jgi:hypothetical protein
MIWASGELPASRSDPSAGSRGAKPPPGDGARDPPVNRVTRCLSRVTQLPNHATQLLKYVTKLPELLAQLLELVSNFLELLSKLLELVTYFLKYVT